MTCPHCERSSMYFDAQDYCLVCNNPVCRHRIYLRVCPLLEYVQYYIGRKRRTATNKPVKQKREYRPHPCQRWTDERKDQLREALDKTSWNIRETAKIMGTSEDTIYLAMYKVLGKHKKTSYRGKGNTQVCP